jgi:2-oxoglutarate dehydrogenase E1 component
MTERTPQEFSNLSMEYLDDLTRDFRASQTGEHGDGFDPRWRDLLVAAPPATEMAAELTSQTDAPAEISDAADNAGDQSPAAQEAIPAEAISAEASEPPSTELPSAEPIAAAESAPAVAVERNGAPQPASEPPSPAAPASAPGRHIGGTRRTQASVTRLIETYREKGHLASRLDPLGRARQPATELELSRFGLSNAAADARWFAGDLPGPTLQSVDQIRSRLQEIYCGTVGVQYMHVPEAEAREWIRQRIESPRWQKPFGHRLQLRILRRLTAATVFEQFVRRSYVGAKTFSLAGSESLIPLLDTIIERAADSSVFEIVLGMAHRGRLNVLANIMGKRGYEIFREFDASGAPTGRGQGDVRYHLGYSSDWLSHQGERLHVSLCFNPSHLEFVNPVALGRTRAKQERAADAMHRRGMTLLIHGDAAFAGEGIVQESLNLGQLPGYTTGGTVHVVINNQLGFTTSPEDGRSTTYATDIALPFGAPVFHVNADDVEAVVRVAHLAVDFRQRFARDVVIDLYCFRRWGHNEADEPAFTQPNMYELIELQPPTLVTYSERLIAAGRITADEAKQLEARSLTRLESEMATAQHTHSSPRSASLGGVWTGHHGGFEPADDVPDTTVSLARLKELIASLTTVPDHFHPHRKLLQGLERRRECAGGERPLDWATGELLALASLAVEGRAVRFTGQDSQRGTFSQRHAYWHDVETDATYSPLANLAPDQGEVDIINSPLCEAGTLGFEFGYSLDYPEALVAWEAQFGDFWNAAQVVFDQFVAAAEDKWSRLSGLVMLLPHGFEGQGPEHSSARLERFLLSAANHNYQVLVPSTPAQYFHALRRQVLRSWRKPLVILTPKSLLRHHAAVSPLNELAEGAFRRVLPDVATDPASVTRVALCSGKVYYDLEKARTDLARSDLAIVRVEQLYPFPAKELARVLDAYPQQTPIVWVQEEPANMGAWQFMQVHWANEMPGLPPLSGITRSESASPATGSTWTHKHEQDDLIARAFA